MATYANGVPTNPTVGAWFEVYTPDADWIPKGTVGFESVDGLVRETAVIEHKQGNDLYSDQIAGRTAPASITIRKALDENNSLERWKAAVEEASSLSPASTRADLIVEMYDRRGTPGSGGDPNKKLLRAWRIQRGWVSRLTTSALTGLANEVSTVEAVLSAYGPPVQIWPTLDTQTIT
jgi:phage tail-like protein